MRSARSPTAGSTCSTRRCARGCGCWRGCACPRAATTLRGCMRPFALLRMHPICVAATARAVSAHAQIPNALCSPRALLPTRAAPHTRLLLPNTPCSPTPNARCRDAAGQGVDLTDEELMEYISESTTMSKAMEEYGDRKSCAITTAKRLSLFLGERAPGPGAMLGLWGGPLRQTGPAPPASTRHACPGSMRSLAPSLCTHARRPPTPTHAQATNASRTRASTAPTSLRAAPRTRPPASAPSPCPSSQQSRPCRARGCASGAATSAAVSRRRQSAAAPATVAGACASRSALGGACTRLAPPHSNCRRSQMRMCSRPPPMQHLRRVPSRG